MTFVTFLLGKGLYKWCKITKMEDFVKGMFHFFKNYQKSEMLEMVIIDKSLLRFVQILKNKWSEYHILILRGRLGMVCRNNVYEPSFCPRKKFTGFPCCKKKTGGGPYFRILGKGYFHVDSNKLSFNKLNKVNGIFAVQTSS